MHVAKRLIPWALMFVVLAAVGCAEQNPKVVLLEQQNATLRAQLAAASKEAQDARRQVVELNQCLTQHIEQLSQTQTQQDLTTRILYEVVAQQGVGRQPGEPAEHEIQHQPGRSPTRCPEQTIRLLRTWRLAAPDTTPPGTKGAEKRYE